MTVGARGARGVAIAALVVGILGLCAYSLLRPKATTDPWRRVPVEGIRLAIRADSPALVRAMLERSPRHAAWLKTLVARAGHRPTEDPNELNEFGFSDSHASVLAQYKDGWLLATAADVRDAAERRWILLEGGERSWLREGAALRRPEHAVAPALGILLAPSTLLAAAGVSSRSAGLFSLLPERLEGGWTPRGPAVDERWTLEGASPLLDLLDPAGLDPSSNDRIWEALPAEADAVELLRIRASRLPGLPDRVRAPELARWCDGIEALLGVPLREVLSQALGGTIGVAWIDGETDAPPRAIAALDLTRPDAALEALERVLALGALASGVRVSGYRDVTIGSRAMRIGGVECEPAAAIEGGLLLLALHRRDVESAIDRLRSRERAASTALWRQRVSSLPRSAWVAECRSRIADGLWARGGAEAASRESPPIDVVAWLRRIDGRWELESRGNAPAWQAEIALPSTRWIRRAW